ncbi:hypothetical protein D9M72_292090 [compost metagenome]
MRQVDQEHGGLRALTVAGARHQDADPGPFRTGDELLASADHPFVAVPDRGGLEHRRVGTGPAFFRRLGHEERGAGLAADQRCKEALLLCVRGDLAQQEHIPLVRRHGVDRDRPEGRQARALEHGRGFELGQVRAVGQDMWRHHAGRARLVAKLGDQPGRRTMGFAARIALIGHHDVADKALDAIGNDTASFCGTGGEHGEPRCQDRIRL